MKKNKNFKVRITSVKRGIRTYYTSQMEKKRFGVTYWVGFSAYRHSGKYYTFIENDCESEDRAKKHINDLKYIFGEDAVEVVPHK